MHFLSEFTQKAVAEVYGTMLGLSVEHVRTDESHGASSTGINGLVSNVGFAGRISGGLYMNHGDKLACDITERLIGMRPASADDAEVADVLGEIANMVTGTMKKHTSALGYNGWLSTPLIMRGEQISIEPKDATVHSYNVFRIPDLDAEIGVWVFAKLQ
jgi:CheY-specific phosphatase CheX